MYAAGMSSPSSVVGRLLTGGVACAAHIAAIAWMGAAFTAGKTLHGGAPVIHVTLEGQGFAGLASLPQEARPTLSKSRSARPEPPTPENAEQAPAPASAPSRPAAPRLSVSRSATSTTGEAALIPQGAFAEAAPSAAPEAAASRASPSPGAGAPLKGASAEEAADIYEAQVIAWLERHKRHPGGIAGRIVVRFTLDRRGRLLASSVVAHDSERLLERIALSQLQEAAPFPRPPSDAAWRTRSFVVRLDYRSNQT